MWVLVLNRGLASYGIPCRAYIASVRLPIPISGCLYQFLGGLWLRFSEATSQSSGEGNGENQLYRTLQLYDASESLSISSENAFVFQEAGESYWGHLDVCTPLQCILTGLGLPNYCE